jgi:hypothetical protein
MLRVLTVGVAALTLFLIGCGGSDSATTATGQADNQEVANVVTGYYAAQANGNTQRACGYLTPARRTQLIGLINGLNNIPGPNDPGQRFGSCADALNFILTTRGGRALVENVHVSGVTASGDSAKAQAVQTSTDGKSTSTTDYVLTKTGSGWKIDRGSGSTTISGTTSSP